MRNFSFYEDEFFYNGLNSAFENEDENQEKIDDYDYLDLIEDLYN